MIIFKYDNSTKKEKEDIWYLGQLFFKKYPFSINYDSKTIGFYFIKEWNNIYNKIIENSGKIKIFVKYILIIFLSLGALFFAYYLGYKAKIRRRKKANEMKDDDYEYVPETIKEININNKKPKLLELNVKF